MRAEHCLFEVTSDTIACLFGSRKDRRSAPPRGWVSARSLRSLQTTVQKAGPAATVSYTLIGAIILLGGIGGLIGGRRKDLPSAR